MFNSGFPGSGLNLMRHLLNQNHNVQCKRDSSLIGSMLKTYSALINAKHEIYRLELAQISKKIITDSYASFILELFLNRVNFSELLCNADFTSIKYPETLREMFVNIKFIVLVRDGRAILNSHAKHSGFTNYPFTFKKISGELLYEQWFKITKSMFDFCKTGDGKDSCLLVCKYYGS